MAGSYDRNWRVGGKSRGTRSQFRLEGLQPFKCTYPVHLTDMMDAGQSTQAGLTRTDFATSPFKETRTRAVREYEQTIDQLRKENFDLKLKIFLTEEENRKKYHNKGDCSDETDNTVQVIVNLRVETENLRKELNEKDQELQNALEQAEKYALELKEVQDKLLEQQELLSLIEQLPTTDEFNEIKDQYSELVSNNEYLSNLLSEKDKEIEATNIKLGELESTNKILEDKIKKRNAAIKGCVMKYHAEVDNIPGEIRTLVKAAVEAARNNSDTEMIAAVENLKASLCQIMPEPSDVFNAEFHTNKSIGDSHIQGSSENFSKTAESSWQQQNSQLSQVPLHHDSELSSADNSENASRDDTRNVGNLSSDFEKSCENEAEASLESVIKVLNENESLKQDIVEKSKIISDLTATCSELENLGKELKQKLEDAYSKVKCLELKSAEEKDKDEESMSKMDSTAQTDIRWHLLQTKISDKNMQDFGNSNSIKELKEEILMLILAIEQKDKELSDSSQKLISLRNEVENSIYRKEDGTCAQIIDEDFSSERDELQRRLAISCSVNNELLKHLQSLERFMEELLHQKNMSTSSLENINETTDFFSQLSKCLDESLKLSHVLSDQLSICEGSKIFESSDVNKEEFGLDDTKSYGSMLESRFSQIESDILSNTQEGMNNFYPSNTDSNKNSLLTGKRRLPFSTMQKSAVDSIMADPDNVVVLKTSNNEDLILLLNDRGDPEDVLIRNNRSILDENVDLDQLRRRCWDTSANTNMWSSEKYSVAHHKENVYNVEQMNTLRPCSVRYNSWMSSDSDTWSEPDRNVSMQRIGIDVQTSPVSSRSPRKSRFKDRRMTDDSTKHESGSSYVKLHPWSRRRRSSETSKMSFVCKKCQKLSQQADDVIREENSRVNPQEMQDLCNENTNQRKELDNLYEVLKDKKELIQSLSEEKQELSNRINNLKAELEELKRSNDLLSSQCSESQNKLIEKDTRNDALKDIIDVLEKKVSDSDSLCDELQSELKQTKDRLVVLHDKCSKYEEKLSLCLKDKEECENSIRRLEEKEMELLKDIEELTSQKNSLLDNLKTEEEHRKTIKNENLELTMNLESKSKEVLELRATNKDLEETKATLLKEKVSAKAELLSSSSLCDKLKAEVKTLKKGLESIKSKCDSYECEIHFLSSSKQTIFETLLSFEETFLLNLRRLSSACGMSFESNAESSESLQSDSTSTEEEDEQINKLVKRITAENIKFDDLVSDFCQQLLDIRILLQENKMASEEDKRKTSVYQRQLELKEQEVKSLTEKIELLQNCIEELKISAVQSSSADDVQRLKISNTLHELEEKENEIRTLSETNCQLQDSVEMLQNQVVESKKSLESVNCKIASSQEQVLSLEKVIEKYKILLSLRDEEIAKQQDRISSLQEQINKLLTEKFNSSYSSPLKLTNSAETAVSPDSSTVMHVSSDSALQYTAKNNSLDGVNDSLVSVESDKGRQSLSTSIHEKDHEKLVRKIKTLQTKLEMSEKRVKILEKEKASLRENLLAYVRGNKRSSGSEEDIDIKSERLAELESKLETKQSFIKELKSSLYKAHDSLIDKQKENDKLARELLKYRKLVEENARIAHQNIPASRVSDTFLHSTETSISELRKQKCELINSLLGLQKQFYETKNIHLRHFEKFSKHIENLRALQVSPSLLKSESAPLLNSSLPSDFEHSRKWDRTLKNTQIDLEVDIECLQNFKIFLKRFFSPIMLQSCEKSLVNCGNDGSSGSGGIEFSKTKDVSIQAIVSEESYSKEVPKSLFKRSSDSIEQLHVTDISSHDRLTATASSISNKLDWVENVLKNVVEEFHHINETDYASNDTSRKTAAKSILLKLFEGLQSLQENADEVFYLNSALKSLEIFDSNLPQGTSKQDMSDRESLLSEETITLSRSESLSPVSFEEHFPSSSIQHRLKGRDHSYPKHAEENKGMSLRPSHKIISSSQDSVFQRSHYSSPDLGIESDPNHEHSAPEQAEKFHTSQVITSRHDLSGSAMHKKFDTLKSSSTYSFNDSSFKLKDDLPFTIGGSLHAIGILQEYELLKKEVAESLVGIKSVLSRTGDGMHHIASYTSPRKKLEYTTFKAIKDTCLNIEVCLQKAHKLVQNFWIAPCPSEEELKLFLQHSEELNARLKRLYESKKKQEKDFKDVLERLKQAEIIKEQQEQRISKKLVKTKKVLRLAEKKILETKNTELPLLAKHSSKMPIK